MKRVSPDGGGAYLFTFLQFVTFQTVRRREAFMKLFEIKWRGEADDDLSIERKKAIERQLTFYSTFGATATQLGIEINKEILMSVLSERERKTLFAGTVPIGLNRNTV